MTPVTALLRPRRPSLARRFAGRLLCALFREHRLERYRGEVLPSGQAYLWEWRCSRCGIRRWTYAGAGELE